MEYWLLDYFREKKFLRITLYFFTCVVLLYAMYFINDASKASDSIYFYNEGLVYSLNILYLILLAIIFLIFVYKILFELRIIKFDIPKVNNLILLVSGGFFFTLLIWYEFYYVTLFYQGEVKLLAGYFIISSILFSLVFTHFLFSKLKNPIILFLIFNSMEYILYEFHLVFLQNLFR